MLYLWVKKKSHGIERSQERRKNGYLYVLTPSCDGLVVCVGISYSIEACFCLFASMCCCALRSRTRGIGAIPRWSGVGDSLMAWPLVEFMWICGLHKRNHNEITWEFLIFSLVEGMGIDMQFRQIIDHLYIYILI